MDNAIIASLLGGTATLITAFVSPLIHYKIQEKRKSKFMPTASITRQDALYGNWIGEMDQKVGIDKLLNKHSLHLNFENSQPIIGTMKLEFKVTDEEYIDDRSIEARIINTIFDGIIFKCDYVNKDNKATHFGTLYEKLSSNGKKISGEFLGYGLISEKFVSGTIEIRKQNDLSNG